MHTATATPAFSPIPRARSGARGDLTRLALLLMIFLNATLGLALLAREPGSDWAATGAADVAWHGNSGPVTSIR